MEYWIIPWNPYGINPWNACWTVLSKHGFHHHSIWNPGWPWNQKIAGTSPRNHSIWIPWNGGVDSIWINLGSVKTSMVSMFCNPDRLGSGPVSVIFQLTNLTFKHYPDSPKQILAGVVRFQSLQLFQCWWFYLHSLFTCHLQSVPEAVNSIINMSQ